MTGDAHDAPQINSTDMGIEGGELEVEKKPLLDCPKSPLQCHFPRAHTTIFSLAWLHLTAVSKDSGLFVVTHLVAGGSGGVDCGDGEGGDQTKVSDINGGLRHFWNNAPSVMASHPFFKCAKKCFANRLDSDCVANQSYWHLSMSSRGRLPHFLWSSKETTRTTTGLLLGQECEKSPRKKVTLANSKGNQCFPSAFFIKICALCTIKVVFQMSRSSQSGDSHTSGHREWPAESQSKVTLSCCYLPGSPFSLPWSAPFSGRSTSEHRARTKGRQRAERLKETTRKTGGGGRGKLSNGEIEKGRYDSTVLRLGWPALDCIGLGCHSMLGQRPALIC